MESDFASDINETLEDLGFVKDKRSRLLVPRYNCHCVDLEFTREGCLGCIFKMRLECVSGDLDGDMKCFIYAYAYAGSGVPILLTRVDQRIQDYDDIKWIRDCILAIIWKYEDAFEVKCLSGRISQYDELKKERSCLNEC